MVRSILDIEFKFCILVEDSVFIQVQEDFVNKFLDVGAVARNESEICSRDYVVREGSVLEECKVGIQGPVIGVNQFIKPIYPAGHNRWNKFGGSKEVVELLGPPNIGGNIRTDTQEAVVNVTQILFSTHVAHKLRVLSK